MRVPLAALAAAMMAMVYAAPAAAQDDDADAWARTAARGVFQICSEEAPDAGRVAEHAEVWGWPPFKGYLEHPDGFRRQAGGESRRDFDANGQKGFVEATVQSGVVTLAAPADISYFRCNVDSDRSVDADLSAYFTGLYGAPMVQNDVSIWLGGAAKGGDPTEDGALKAVGASGPGASAVIVELSHRAGHDEARLTEFLRAAPVG